MAKSDRQGKGGGQIARPSLEPANPLKARTAFMQAAILLGIPVGLLLFAKVILRMFFPQLGY
jgi:hypothetical protein